jgi:hypothetical protein
MIGRRTVVSWLLLAPAAAAAQPGRKAPPPPPAIGSVLVGGKPVTPISRGIFSSSNDNDVYTAVVELPLLPAGAPTLVLATTPLPAASWGSGFGKGKGSASFSLDRAGADALAAVWQVARKDRTPLGDGLVATWRAKARTFRAGKAMSIAVTIKNTSATPVGFQMGGMLFNGRDDHFHFEASRAGVVVPPIERGGVAGGGSFVFKALQRGDAVTLVEDLGQWVTLTRPGVYQVACEFRALLVPGTRGASWPDHGHEEWRRVFAKTLTIRVT